MGVFLVAGAAKLADPAGSRRAMIEFGVTARLAGIGAIALPLCELAVAFALLPASSARYAATGAAGLLTLFTGAIAYNLARGNAPDCHCFGQLHSAPAGPHTLLRSAALAALAAFVLVAGWRDPGAGVPAAIGALDAAEIGLLVLGAALVLLAGGGAWAFVQLLRQHGRVLVRLDMLEAALQRAGIELEHEDREGVPIGSEAPGFALPGLDGATVSLEDLRAGGRAVALVFMSPNCGPCEELMPGLARWQSDSADDLKIAVISSGPVSAVREIVEEHDLDLVLVDDDRVVSRLYDAVATPSAVLIGADGTVASGVAGGRGGVEALLRRASEPAPPTRAGLPLGTEAPPISLPGLRGEILDLSDIATGSGTLVLFWNPRCSFCREMHDDLLAREETRPEEAPALVVVSSGSAADTAAEGFRSTVLLDPDGQAARAFGANGTPMAVLVDADARIASLLAAGAKAVLALLGIDGPHAGGEGARNGDEPRDRAENAVTGSSASPRGSRRSSRLRS